MPKRKKITIECQRRGKAGAIVKKRKIALRAATKQARTQLAQQRSIIQETLCTHDDCKELKEYFSCRFLCHECDEVSTRFFLDIELEEEENVEVKIKEIEQEWKENRPKEASNRPEVATSQIKKATNQL